MKNSVKLPSGRKLERTYVMCHACNSRVAYGEPKENGAWPTKLSLTEDQIEYMLAAAVEFVEICETLGEDERVVDFLDWIRIDALRIVRDPLRHPEAEGVSRLEGGGRTGGGARSFRHTSAFPLPVLDRRTA